MRCGVSLGTRGSNAGCGMRLIITVDPCWRMYLGPIQMPYFYSCKNFSRLLVFYTFIQMIGELINVIFPPNNMK